MNTTPSHPESVVAAIRAGDENAFAALAERHRREIQLHCYRMVGSLEDAEDLTQETLLRAWRRRASFAGRAPLRAWLYGIATNACLDLIRRRPRLASVEVPWLQPYPDDLLEGAVSGEVGPGEQAVARETVELAFLVAVQHLSARSRAVLIVRDVLGWSARETADLLDMSVPAANSALQRARTALRERLPVERRLEWGPDGAPTAAERELVRRYVDASERGDAQALAATLTEDAVFSMPPQPGRSVGREIVVGSWVEGGFGSDAMGPLRCVLTAANRQTAVACYVRRPGSGHFAAMALDVLRVGPEGIQEITTFEPLHFPAFGLPDRL